MNRFRNRSHLLLPLAVGLLAVCAPGALAERAVSRPDLVETGVASYVAAVPTEKPFKIHDRVRNRGAAAAKSSLTRYFIKRGGTRVPIGLRKIPRLGPGKASAGTGVAIVPSEIPTGAYPLVACADSAGAVRESNERNNCLTASHKLKVTKLKPLPARAALAQARPDA
jgi:CARDB